MKDEDNIMQPEYDFSNAVRGKFYRPLQDIEIPIYLEHNVREFYSHMAEQKNLSPDELINRVLKKEMELIQEIQ